MGILYRPEASVAADFIPFFWKGKYHLFYLRDWRDPQRHGEGTPWWHLVTEDFVRFEEWGEALPRGAQDEQDLYVFTGSVFEADGTFHIFYTGHNSHLRKAGKPEQSIMHATSLDLRTWTKDAGFRFFAPADLGYEPHDWRDPFIYWDERYKEYAMLLAARKSDGPVRFRGCTALATSPDLKTWKVRPPFWAPDEYYTHECPDLFRIGKWCYLVYSTFTERCVTHYRMSKSLDGPWLAPANDTFDARAYYAAKTAGDGKRRFVFGWLPTRAEDKDEGAWQWGGDLVVHEIKQQRDGTLTVQVPRSVMGPFRSSRRVIPAPVLGAWTCGAGAFSADAVGRHSILSLGDLPQECVVSADVVFERRTAGCGLLLRSDATSDAYYQLRLEPANQRLVVDRWPRPGDQPFMLERPLAMKPGRAVRLRVLVSGTCLVVYVDDLVALSCRMYDHRQGGWGLFVTEGRATFRSVTVKLRR